MLRNRFFKSLFGVQIEALVAKTLDVSGAPVPGIPGTAGTATASVTVAGTPTLADAVVLEFGPHTFEYTVAAGDTTAAIFGTSILAALNADAYFVANGVVWTKSGTTSLVLTATGPVGSALNGTVLVFRAGAVNAGPTFSSFSSTNVTGGVNPANGQQPNYDAFITNAPNGSLGVYYEEHTSGATANPAVSIGDTKLPANYGRRIFYACKDNVGNTYRTTALSIGVGVDKIKYAQTPYAAGQNDIWTVTCVNRPTVGQTINVLVVNTTGTIVPYPTYRYTAVVAGTSGSIATATQVETALALIAAQINAETNDPVATASASSDNSMVLTITGNNTSVLADSGNTLKIAGVYSETTPAVTVDYSTWTITQTQRAIAPTGTVPDVTEFEKYFVVQQGMVLYSQAGTLPGEFNSEFGGGYSSNVASGTNYGYLVVSSRKENIPEGGTRTYKDKATIVIALPTASLATLASY